MGRISRNEILQACINGVKNSFDEYREWTSDEWLWQAPEYLLTVNIAKEIWKIPKKSKFLTLEDNVKSTLTNANVKIKGRLENSIRPSGPSDIILWWGKGTPRGIIEVKNAVYQKKDIQEDLNRIYGMLEKESDMQFGAFVFYLDRHFERGNAVKNLEERIKNEFIQKIEKEVETNKFKYKPRCSVIETKKNDKDAAYAFAGMISK